MPSSGAWVMWAVSAWLFLIAFFHRPAPGVIARELMQAFDVSGVVIGLLAATYYPLEAYRAAFAICAVVLAASAATTLFVPETRGENIYARLRGHRTARAASTVQGPA